MKPLIFVLSRGQNMQEEIRVIVVDDEEMWLQVIATTLNDFGYTVVGTAGDFESAMGIISNGEYDIALLDININGKNRGIELGKILTNVYNKPFVFITGSTDSHTVQDAINAGPSAYLTKPVHPASLVATVQSAINNFTNKATPTANVNADNNQFFFIKQGNKYKKLEWQNIIFLRSDKNYTTVYNSADKMEYFIRSPLSRTISMIIPPTLRSSFVQINRGEAVNIHFIQELANEEVHAAGHTFIVTDSFAPTLKKALTIIT